MKIICILLSGSTSLRISLNLNENSLSVNYDNLKCRLLYFSIYLTLLCRKLCLINFTRKHPTSQ